MPGRLELKERFGFIGLGSQGAPIARRMIDAGMAVVLWARRPESIAPFRNTPATFASSLAELAEQIDHVGICVVSDSDVRQVCHQLLPFMRRGARVAVHSTVHPDTCRSLADEAAARGVTLIDAPVSGGGPAAEAGALTVMVGGSVDAYEAAKPVFSSFGRLIVHVGDVGAGQMAKLINNTLFAANLSVTHHALAAAGALGISREILVKLLAASSGRSFALDVCARMVEPTAFAHGAALLEKDVKLLGEVSDPNNASYIQLRDAAKPFIDLALSAA